MGSSFGGSRRTRTAVLLTVTTQDYTFRTLFNLTIRNFTIPLFLEWFGLLRTNPPLVPFRIGTTPL
jgi:hypothetical protein